MQGKIILLGLILLITALGGQIPQSVKTEVTQSILGNSLEGSPAQNPQPDFYPVVRAVDGDTIVVHINGVDEKIRLIGVDTPESVDPRKPVQCFGKEASQFTASLLDHKNVRLEIDTAQGERDKYQRLLRYVFLEDGTLLNKKIIADGYGHEYTYKIPYQHQQEFKAAQNEARIQKRGLWADGACVKN